MTTFPLHAWDAFYSIDATRIYQSKAGTNETLPQSMGIEGRGATVTITYDYATHTYNLVDKRSYTVGYSDGSSKTFPGSSATFARSNSVSNKGYFNTYEVQSPTTDDTLDVYRNLEGRGNVGNLPLRLSYLSFARWSHTDLTSGDTRQHYLLFGTATEQASLPVSGSASYDTLVSANTLTISSANGNVGVVQELGGTASFEVNFATGAISTQLDLARTSDSASFGSYTGTGALYGGDQFKGNFTSSKPDFQSGGFMGGFYGPQAQEMGYAFDIYNYDDGTGGASVRPKVYNEIEGVVVGAKH